MAIEDAQQLHEMRMRIHAQDMADAEYKRKRDEIKMIQDRHPGIPLRTGGAH